MLKVIIAGGREFHDYKIVRDTCIHTLSRFNPSEIEIVSGGAKGADSLGERFADEFGGSVKVFPADWANQGKSAGPRRNEEMAKYADGLIAFDTGGRGTAGMIKLAKKAGLKVRVVECQVKG